jgi:hypothetical protein
MPLLGVDKWGAGINGAISAGASDILGNFVVSLAALSRKCDRNLVESSFLLSLNCAFSGLIRVDSGDMQTILERTDLD